MDSGSAGSSSAETSRGRSARDRRRDFLREVPGAVPPRHRRRGGELVQVPVGNAHRERAELGAEHLHRVRGHQRGVEAAAEEGADRHIAGEMEGHGLAQQLVDLLEDLGLAGRHLGPEAQVPVAPDPRGPVFPDQVVGGREGEDALVEGIRRLHEPEREVLVEREGRHPGEARIVRQQRLDLGGEREPAALLGVEQRLLPELVAREQQPAVAPVPEREREHPAQPLEHPLAEVLVQVHEDLGVRPGPELMSRRRQLPVERFVVVDLAVEHDEHAAVLVRDRLVAAGQVDDAEAAHAEADPALDEGAPVVGAPMADGIAHPLHFGIGDGSGSDRPYDAAHVRRPSFPRSPSCTPRRTG